MMVNYKPVLPSVVIDIIASGYPHFDSDVKSNLI